MGFGIDRNITVQKWSNFHVNNLELKTTEMKYENIVDFSFRMFPVKNFCKNDKKIQENRETVSTEIYAKTCIGFYN